MPKKVRPPPDEMRDLGARIVRFRNELGLNQAELAARAGVDGSALNRVEQRKVLDPAAAFVLRIASALGRSTDLLLTGHATAPPIALLAEPGVPRELVEATAREIAVRVIPLIPSQASRHEQGRPERSSSSRKVRGAKRNASKA